MARVMHSKRMFGDFNRFAIYFHELSTDEAKQLTGCFGMWFVEDAERTDELTGLPSIVAQEYTEAAALKKIYDRYPHAFLFLS